MLTKGAIGNLINRYRAVLKKCNLMNTFGSLAVASMLVLGGAGVAVAEPVEIKNNISSGLTSGVYDITENVTISAKDTNHSEYFACIDGQTSVTIKDGKTLTLDHVATDYTSGALGGGDGNQKISIRGSNAYLDIQSEHASAISHGNVEIDIKSFKAEVGGYGIYNSGDGETKINAADIEITSGKDAVHMSGASSGDTILTSGGSIKLTGRAALRHAASTDVTMSVTGNTVTLNGGTYATVYNQGVGAIEVTAYDTLTINAGSKEAIHATGGTTTLTAANKATITGDIKVEGAKLTLSGGEGSTITGRITAEGASEVNLTGVSFVNQQYGNVTGGAMLAKGTTKSVIKNALFEGLNAEGGYYAAIGSGSDAVVEIENTVFRNNSAKGGAAVGLFGIGKFTNVTFENNVATSAEEKDSAGALFLGAESSAEIGGHDITGCTFTGNSTGSRGGAIATREASRANNKDGKISIVNSTFTNNTAGTMGGALYNTFYTTASISGSTFTGNTAAEGGAIYNDGALDSNNKGAALVITNGTFTGNSASRDGGAIFNSENAELTLEGENTFSGNTAGTVECPVAAPNAATGKRLNDIHNDGKLTINGTTTLDGGICGTGTLGGNGTIVMTNPEGVVTARLEDDHALKAEATPELSDKLGGDVEEFKKQFELTAEDGETPAELVSYTMQEGMVADGVDENGTPQKNRVMDAVLKLSSVTNLSLDRILTNDVRKRMGDLRTDSEQQAVWMRWDGGKLAGYDGFSNNFNSIQIGADSKFGFDNTRFGIAASFTHGDGDFSRGSSEMEGFSFAAYGTWMAENGLFADVVARIGSFENEMYVEGRKGDLDSLISSLSGELGWRFDVCKSFYIEPQLELAYSYVKSDDLQLGDAKYVFDDVDSLIGRAGFAAGWKIGERGDIYARASVVQQFLGDAKVTGAVTGGKACIQELDGNDTWFEYGVGGQIKLTDKTYIWADVERTEGATIDEEWRGTVGIRFSF